MIYNFDREHLYEALDYVAKGKVRVMTETFPLEEISNAYDKVVMETYDLKQ